MTKKISQYSIIILLFLLFLSFNIKQNNVKAEGRIDSQNMEHVFKDPNLLKWIKRHADFHNVPSKEITQEYLNKIENIYIDYDLTSNGWSPESEKSIHLPIGVSLEGLEYFRNAYKMEIVGLSREPEKISDAFFNNLTFIENLKTIKELNITGLYINSSLEFLKNMNITNLELNFLELNSNISLPVINSLESLSVNYLKMNNFSQISDQHNLKSLRVEHNEFKDEFSTMPLFSSIKKLHFFDIRSLTKGKEFLNSIPYYATLDELSLHGMISNEYYFINYINSNYKTSLKKLDLSYGGLFTTRRIKNEFNGLEEIIAKNQRFTAYYNSDIIEGKVNLLESLGVNQDDLKTFKAEKITNSGVYDANTNIISWKSPSDNEMIAFSNDDGNTTGELYFYKNSEALNNNESDQNSSTVISNNSDKPKKDIVNTGSNNQNYEFIKIGTVFLILAALLILKIRKNKQTK